MGSRGRGTGAGTLTTRYEAATVPTTAACSLEACAAGRGAAGHGCACVLHAPGGWSPIARTRPGPGGVPAVAARQAMMTARDTGH